MCLVSGTSACMYTSEPIDHGPHAGDTIHLQIFNVPLQIQAAGIQKSYIIRIQNELQ